MSSSVNCANLKSERARLVGLNTQNPQARELDAAHFIMGHLQHMGCRAETLDLGAGRANEAGTFESGPGPSSAFIIPIDVVPAEEGRTGDTFTLREETGLLFGRSSYDANGPMMAMLGEGRLPCPES